MNILKNFWTGLKNRFKTKTTEATTKVANLVEAPAKYVEAKIEDVASVPADAHELLVNVEAKVKEASEVFAGNSTAAGEPAAVPANTVVTSTATSTDSTPKA